MIAKTDEDILKDCYELMREQVLHRTKNGCKPGDIQLLGGISTSCSKLIIYLDPDIVHSRADINKYACKAKRIYFQYLGVKVRNPSFKYGGMDKKMEILMGYVCKHEADMLSLIRQQETRGELMNLEEILTSKKGLSALKMISAGEIVKNAIRDGRASFTITERANAEYEYFVSATGKKYHLKDCPFCRGRELTGISKGMIENQKMIPCVCVLKESYDDAKVTVFIDESLKNLKYAGRTGNYSYIVCKGNLDSEKEITEENICIQGVDYTKENEHVELLTESAIGKVLIMLAYDMNYSGAVKIYIDNKSVVDRWNTSQKNKRLTRLFKSVDINFVHREQNKKADKLLRTKLFMTMDAVDYNRIIAKSDTLDIWKKQRDLIKQDVIDELAYLAKDTTNPETKTECGEMKIMNLVLSLVDSMLDKFKLPTVVEDSLDAFAS